MSRRVIPLLAAFLLASLASAAPVPPAPKDDSAPSSAVRLVEHRHVQKELKMSAEQRLAVLDGLGDLAEEVEKKFEALARMPNPPDDAFEKVMRDHRKGADRLLAEAAEKLTDAQRKRLRQIDWRVRGVAAFADPQVQKLLQLTDAQRKTASELAGRLKNELDRFLEGQIDGDEAKGRADLFSVRKDVLKQMEAALTVEQKTAWTAMLGAEPTGFKVEELWLRVEEDADLLPPEPGK
jgi:hypothetical protein